MWLFEKSGRITPELISGDDGLEVTVSEVLSAGSSSMFAADSVFGVSSITLIFEHHGDGRGFSVAAKWRSQGYNGRLYAAGDLLPDQLSQAFQSGFDGVKIATALVQQHGENHWRRALQPALVLSYPPYSSSAASSIWVQRSS